MWNAPSEQYLPKTARASRLRMLLAACSRSRAKMSDDLGVVWSSFVGTQAVTQPAWFGGYMSGQLGVERVAR